MYGDPIPSTIRMTAPSGVLTGFTSMLVVAKAGIENSDNNITSTRTTEDIENEVLFVESGLLPAMCDESPLLYKKLTTLVVIFVRLDLFYMA